MNRRMAAVCCTALALLLGTAWSGAVAAPADRDDEARGEVRGEVRGGLPDIYTLNGRAAETENTFVGADGRTHAYAPKVVFGRRGELFFGPEFNAACAYGPNYAASVKPIARIARAIENSGRKAIWTLAPAKVTVFPDRIRTRHLPHKRCDKVGLKEQARVMRTYDDPRYLPLVDALASSSHQTYYKTDAHWSTVGGSVFAKQLAKRLSKPVAKAQRFRYGTEQWQGMLSSMRDVYEPETAELATPRTGQVTVTESAASPWPGWPAFTYRHSWRSTKSAATYPGRTLLVGDSFTMFALENLRPMFRNGRWLWYAGVDLDEVIDAIVESDTVVLELYQTFTAGTSITDPHFLRKLRRALR